MILPWKIEKGYESFSIEKLRNTISEYSEEERREILRELIKLSKKKGIVGNSAKATLEWWGFEKNSFRAVTNENFVLFEPYGTVTRRAFGFNLPSGNEAFKKIFPEPKGEKTEVHIWAENLRSLFGLDGKIILCKTEEAQLIYDNQHEEKEEDALIRVVHFLKK